MKEGFQVPPVAEVEAKRGTSDPTYLYYNLGKLQILKLREDYRKQQGRQIHAAGIPRPLHAAGIGAHEDHPQEHAGE